MVGSGISYLIKKVFPKPRDTYAFGLAIAINAAITATDLVTSDRSVPPMAPVLPPLIAASFASPIAVAITATASGITALAIIARDNYPSGEGIPRVVLVIGTLVISLFLALARERRERSLSHAEYTSSLAETLQAGLLPVPFNAQGRVRTVTRYQPGEDRLLLGGDFYDVISADNEHIAFLIGDVAGHGPRAAALSAELRASWRALVLTTPDPESWIKGMAAVFDAANVGDEMFVTTCTGKVNDGFGQGKIILAGHPAPLLVGGTTRLLEDIEVGLPLGVDDRPYKAAGFDLGPFWQLLLYTDGVIEGRDAPGSRHRAGVEALVEWVNSSDQTTSETLLDGIVAKAIQANGAPLDDDVALVLLSAAR